MRRRRKHRHGEQSPARLEDLIPGDRVDAHRRQHGEIAVEVRASTDRGVAVSAGEYATTAMRKLLLAEHVTSEEMAAAQKLQRDWDQAYGASVNVLAKIQVDGTGGGGDRFTAMEFRAHHGIRCGQAADFLGEDMALAARICILGDAETPAEKSFTAVGQELAPSFSRRDQSVVGKFAVMHAARRLAVFYGFRNPQARKILTGA